MSSQRNKFQKRKFSFFLVIGFFLSVCLALLENAILLPSWMGPLVPLLIFAFGALVVLVETIKEEDTSTNQTQNRNRGRRAFFNRLILPASAIGLLTILDSFLTIKEAGLEKEQQAFDVQRKSQLKELRIGFLPIGNDPGGVLDTSTLNNGLTNLLSIPVTSASVGTTYTDTIRALAGGNIEVGWLGPLSYVYAHQKYGAKVILCRLTREGQKVYHSYIITNKNTGIRTLQDLKGRRFAFVDPYSTSGNLVPRYELKKAGLDSNNDIMGFYAKTHEQVIQQVLSGQVPAGAVSSDNYDAYQEKLGQKGSDLIILFKSPIDIPEGPVAVRKDIQLYDTLRIEDAFLTIGESPTILNTINIAGFAKATDETYQDLLKIAAYLNIDISTYNG